MENIEKLIETILNKKATVLERVDELLELDRDTRDLGKGHTKTQKKESRAKSTKIYKAINTIDPATGSLLLKSKDK